MKGTKGLFRLGMAALALSFMTVLAGCDNPASGGDDGGEEIKSSISAKWEIDDPSSPYASFEFNQENNYIVVERMTAAGAAATVYTGVYIVSGGTIRLVNFGDLDNMSFETDNFSFSVQRNDTTVNCTATKAGIAIDSSPETDRLCHSWKIAAVNGAALSSSRAEGTMTFSPYGTYMIYLKIPNQPESVELAEWSWGTPGQIIFYVNSLNQSGTATISQFTSSNLQFTDSANYSYGLTR
jgi:hypothetical protein